MNNLTCQQRMDSSLRLDLSIHLVSFLIQAGWTLTLGIGYAGSTPPVVYPFLLILATITLFRQVESLSIFQSRLILLPATISFLIYGFCLISEMTRDFWGFSMMRQFPVIYRIIWYQLGLLLIHPEMYPRVCSWLSIMINWLQDRGFFSGKLWLSWMLLLCLVWLTRSTVISPDGYDWLKHSLKEGTWINYLREPLGMLIFRITVFFGNTLFNWEPYISIFLLIFLCGMITTWLLWHVLRYFLPQDFILPLFTLVLSSTGYTLIFWGNIEIYALLHLFFVLFLWASVRYFQDQCGAWLPGLMFGILFCVHLSAGWWLPAFLLLPYIKRQINHQTSIVHDSVQLNVLFVSFVVAFWLFILLNGYGGDFQVMAAHFLSDEVMFVGTDQSMFRPLSSFTDLEYYLTMLNEYVYMIPAFFILAGIVFCTVNRLEPDSPFLLWSGILAGFYFIYSMLWNPDRKFPWDWDIFSGLTLPLLLCFGTYVSSLKIERKVIHYVLYQTIIFSFNYLFWLLAYSHIKGAEYPLYFMEL